LSVAADGSTTTILDDSTDDNEIYRADDEQQSNISSVNCYSIPLTSPAGCFPVSVTVDLLPISSDIFLRITRRVDCWSCSHVLYQLPPPAVPSPLFLSYTVVLHQVGLEKIIKISLLRILSLFFHCSTWNTFGYNVVEPFSTVLFRTADIIALLTVGSEMTPMCKATVNALI